MREWPKTIRCFIYCCIVTIQLVFANERKQIDPGQMALSIEKLRDQQRLERGQIKRMLDENQVFERLGPQWEEMIREFQGDTLGKFFLPENFQKFLNKLRPHQYLDANQSQWMETPLERILILQLSAAQDGPVDIKVNQNEIIVDATIEERRDTQDSQGNKISSYSQSSFHKIIPVPSDCEGERAVVEQKGGEIWIKIPKKK